MVNPFAALSPIVLLATALRQVQASVSSRDAGGDACLPLDIITLLKSETCDAVAFACQQEIQDGASCSSECYDASTTMAAWAPPPALAWWRAPPWLPSRCKGGQRGIGSASVR